MFNSPGMLIRTAECSICGKDYEDCLHVKGRPYMGQFCARVIKDVEFTEVSFVDDPADKRCYITSYSDDGGTTWTDAMTMRKIERPPVHAESD